MVERVKSAYRSQAERDEEDNVVPIRPVEAVVPKAPPIWPWVILGLFGVEIAVAYGFSFVRPVFVYLGALDVVLMAGYQAFMAHERNMEINHTKQEKAAYTAKLDSMAMKLIENVFAYGSFSDRTKYADSRNMMDALKAMYPLISEEERKDIERRIFKIAA